jgi:hypothetical protein
MKKISAIALLVLALPAPASAHRLDEYLQAARLSLARDRITLEVDMTPGMNVAQAIAALVDGNGDGVISQSEAGAYGESVLKELVLELNARAVPLTLTRVEIPSRDELNDGMGTIQLRATGRVHVAAGRHELHFRNNHQPAGSVYLANALLPEDAGVAVLAQARDPRQQSIRIDYEVEPPWAKVLWVVVAVTLLAASFSRTLRSAAA